MSGTPDKYGTLFGQYERSTRRFREAVERMNTTAKMSDEERVFFRDSVIKRFEISFDLAWKALKELLRSEYGTDVASPKKAFQEAFKQGLIDNDARWLALTDIRNETIHAYNEIFSEQIVVQLPGMAMAFEALLKQLQPQRSSTHDA